MGGLGSFEDPCNDFARFGAVATNRQFEQTDCPPTLTNLTTMREGTKNLFSRRACAAAYERGAITIDEQRRWSRRLGARLFRDSHFQRADSRMLRYQVVQNLD